MSIKLEKLKKWRDEMAQRSGKPAYYILTNKNLEDALGLSPENHQELENISGWGPKKVEKYGQEILTLINSEGEVLQKENLIRNTKSEESILSVAQYINFINLTVQQFNEIKVSGEISDLSGMARGLAFFDLKDNNDLASTMQCVIFRNNFQYLNHLLENGLEVVIYGLPSVYSKNGNFKFVVTRIEPKGEGSYKKILEKLRKKLLEKGYFSEERKRVLPIIIRKIGLITSGNGAAIHDFQQNLANFGFEVSLKNVYVEGEQAEGSITDAIHSFNQHVQKIDVLVIIRGGGSWESLKAFNSERIVEAVVSSRIPVVTGIGHENDETFVGMSSDLDCSTPSIVAIQISRTREKILEKIFEFSKELESAQEDLLSVYQKKIESYLSSLSFNIEKVFNNFNQSVKKLFFLLNEKIFQITSLLQKIENFKSKIISSAKASLCNKTDIIKLSQLKINFLNPKNILKNGFGVVYSIGGRIIDSVKKIKNKESIKIELTDGSFEAKVSKIKI